MSDIAVFLGNRIRELRKAQKMSQEELAYRSSINPAHLGQIERALKNPTLDTIDQIAAALNISLSELFNPYIKVQEQLIDNITMGKIQDLLSGMSHSQQKDILKLIKLIQNFNQ